MNFRGIGRYLEDYALLWPGIVITLIASAVLALPISRRLRTSPVVAFLLTGGFGLIISATLTPSRDALTFGATGTGTCQVTAVDLDTLRAMLHFGDPAFNLLLFVPLGIACGLLAPSKARTAIVVCALCLSPLVELVQLLVVALDRACQTSDIVDNLTGLVAGFAIGWAVRLAIEVARSDGQGVEPAPDEPR